jgi:hypothetical protein
MEKNEDNFQESSTLRTRMDGLTAAMVILAAVLLLNVVLLWLSHDSNSTRLDTIEQAIQLSEVAR